MAKHDTIIWTDILESTNDALSRRVENLDNLSAIACMEQTCGRGQGDHRWFSRKGESLTFSILFRYEDSPLQVSELILTTCVATLGIRDHLLSRGIETRIKWPNDIWAGDRKICGILIENVLSGRNVGHSVVGIGLNVNTTDFPSSLPNPVSMKMLTGKTYSIGQELSELHESISRRFSQLAEDGGRIALQEEFEKYMFRLP